MQEVDDLSQNAHPAGEQVEQADVVLGLATYNNGEAAGAVLDAAIEGMTRYFPPQRAVVIQADGGSTDGTNDVIRTVAGRTFPVRLTSYSIDSSHFSSRTVGGGEALRSILAASSSVQPKACVFLSTDLRNFTPEWLERLLRPVLDDDYDLVAPYYQRQGYEGTINSGLIYPLIRALYGKRIRYPLAPDAAISHRLLDVLSSGSRVNGTPPGSAGPSLTTAALTSGLRVCEGLVGPRVVEFREGNQAGLSEMLSEVLSVVFSGMSRNVQIWQRIKGSEEVEIYGPLTEPSQDALPAFPHRRMIDSFRQGYQDLKEIWGLLIPPAGLLELKRLTVRPDAEFILPDEVWARTVFDFAVGYHFRTIGREHILKAFTPLYLGWVASFLQQLQGSDVAQLERRLERLCLAFEAEKRYLISRWRWPDRFNP